MLSQNTVLQAVQIGSIGNVHWVTWHNTTQRNAIPVSRKLRTVPFHGHKKNSKTGSPAYCVLCRWICHFLGCFHLIGYADWVCGPKHACFRMLTARQAHLVRGKMLSTPWEPAITRAKAKPRTCCVSKIVSARCGPSGLEVRFCTECLIFLAKWIQASIGTAKMSFTHKVVRARYYSKPCKHAKKAHLEWQSTPSGSEQLHLIKTNSQQAYLRNSLAAHPACNAQCYTTSQKSGAHALSEQTRNVCSFGLQLSAFRPLTATTACIFPRTRAKPSWRQSKGTSCGHFRKYLRMQWLDTVNGFDHALS